MTEREKLRITADYFRATGDLDKETQTYELWIANYPRDYVPQGNLGANYAFLGQWDKALAEGKETLRLAPDDILSYSNLGSDYFNMNRLDEAKASFGEALAHNLDGGILRENQYLLSFLRGDTAQLEQQAAWGVGKPGVEDVLLSMQSDTEAYYGRMGKAGDW